MESEQPAGSTGEVPAAEALSAPPQASFPPKPSAPARVPAWLYLVPIVCLLATVALWYDTRREIAALSAEQRQLAADLDAARGLSTINVAGAPARGPAGQILTLVEFSDYECPFCIRHFRETMPEIDAKWVQTGKLRYVFRDFPIDQLHPAAIHGHVAARCAAEQGKFWEMHGRMFSAPGTHTPPEIELRASEAGVAIDPFRECVSSGRAQADVAKNVQLAVELGANGTPAFFVGVRNPETEDVRIVTAVSGAQPFEAFEKAFETVLARIRQ
jgi:protein-disulfide isomerase